MKKLNTKKQLKNLITGQPATEFRQDDPEGPVEKFDITVGNVISRLLYNYDGNKARSFALANKISSEDKVELLAEDVAFIKGIIDNSKMSAMYAGQLLEILESDNEKDEVEVLTAYENPTKSKEIG